MTGSVHAKQLDRSDIEAKLRQVHDHIGSTAAAAKPAALTVVAVTLAAFTGLAFAVGARKGRKQTTIVEIRRV